MKRWLASPLVWILAAAAGLRLAGLAWGLPAADGWDDDGFAPRNFLTALALTWKPGAFFTYPPLHALLLAVPCLPVAALALAQAPSLSQHDVIATITQPQYMTTFAVVARAINLILSLGIIWIIGAMARLVAGPRVGLFAAAAAALNVTLTYYGQVSNLDVPYLFWGLLSLFWCMRAVMEQAPRRFWLAALFAAAAVATKDQAYALFMLSLPVFAIAWFLLERWPRTHAGTVIKMVLPATVVALFLVLLVDGALTNPSGFARRLAFLTGPASQDYAAYLPGPRGWLALLSDMLGTFANGYGWLAMALAVSGLVLHLHRAQGVGRLAGLLPVLAMISFTLCFNFAALRSDARFLLPQGLLAAYYIGIAAEALAFAAQDGLRLAGRVLVTAAGLLALHWCIGVNAAFLLDPRYDAEAWLRAHVRPGDRIETFGQNAYLPRFPSTATVLRPGPRPVETRNPLPGITEMRLPFDAPLGARFIVVSDWWLRHYTEPQSELGNNRNPSPAQQALFGDASARRYFTALREERAGYRLVHAARAATGFWPRVHIHESLNETILVFERRT